MLETSFTCPNGHGFVANAKIRARCPSCGSMARRKFGEGGDNPARHDNSDGPTDAVPTKPASVTPPVGKGQPTGDVTDRKKPVIVRHGRPNMTTRKAPTPPAKKAAPKRAIPGAKVANGLVKKTVVKQKGVAPKITGRPPKTAVARTTVTANGKKRRYWEDVADRFGF